MKTKQFDEAVDRIVDLFDGLVREAEYGDDDYPLTDFLCEEEYGKMNDLFSGKTDDKKSRMATDCLWNVRNRSFAVGYVIGQLFEITYPEAQKDVKVIKEIIRKNQLLPFFPREAGQRKVGLFKNEPKAV